MSNNLQITGKIVKIDETQTFSSGFQKREFVVETEDKYPQKIKLEFLKDKVNSLDAVSPGDVVEVGFNLRGSEYNGKFYVNLVAWRMEILEGAPAQQARSLPPKQEEDQGIEEMDDIPF